MRLHAGGVVLTTASVTLAAIVAAAPGRSQPAASQLDLHASLSLEQDRTVPCPPGSPAALVCPAGKGEGVVTGLGAVTATYTVLLHTGPPFCTEGTIKRLGYPARWVVANKGEIHVAVAESAQCFLEFDLGSATLAFTVTGGTGIYAGASGSGTVSHVASPSGDGKFRGVQQWNGTLTVPGLDFDLTAPTLTGAANKTVKAKKGARSARVTFQVTARDDRDGALPVTCAPRSGSRFRIGRTRVVCTATDSSANRKAAAFTVTVRR
jgi:hypothetical protein